MDFDHFYHAVSNSGYMGINLTLMVPPGCSKL